MAERPTRPMRRIIKGMVRKMTEVGYDQEQIVLNTYSQKQAIEPQEPGDILGRFLNDSLIDWTQEPEAVYKAVNEYTFRDRAGTLIADLLRSSNSRPDLQEALNIISDEPNLQDPKNVLRWLYTFITLAAAHDFSIDFRNDPNIDLKPLPGSVLQVLEKKFQSFSDQVEDLRKSPLTEFIIFADNFYWASLAIGKDPKFYKRKNDSRKRPESFTVNSWNHLETKIKDIWHSRRQGWTEQEIVEVTNVIDNNLRHSNTLSSTIAALELNISTKKFENPLPLQNDPAILGAINFRWASEQYDLDELMPGLKEIVESSAQLSGFSVPRKYLSSLLLSYLENISFNKNSLDTLCEISQGIEPSRKTESAWLTTLLSLRERHPEISVVLETFLESAQTIENRTKETFKNLRPGKVWLTASGRLKTGTPNEVIANAFPIYASSTNLSGKSPEDHPQEIHTIDIPFLGEVELLKPEEIKVFFQSNHRNLILLDDEHLLKDFSITQSNNHMREQSTLLFLNKLNSEDPRMKEARKLGILAVYISGDDLIFQIDSKNGTNLGFAARLENIGKNLILEIDGFDKSFIGEPLQLALNNLAVALRNRTFIQDFETEPDFAKIIQDWNKSERGKFPRINANPKHGYISIFSEGRSILASES